MARVKKEEVVPGPEFKVTRIPMPKVTQVKPKQTSPSPKLVFWFAIIILAVLFLQAVATISTLQGNYNKLDKSHWELIEAINKNPQNYENITN